MFYLFALLILILDQVSKYTVCLLVPRGDMITVIDGFLYWTHIYNKGAAWGLFEGMNYIFIPFAFVAVIAFSIAIRRFDHVLMKTAFSLILGGTAGNLADRLFRGEGVLDFIKVHIFTYTDYPVFNIADSAIVIGAVSLAIMLLFDDKLKAVPSGRPDESGGTDE